MALTISGRKDVVLDDKRGVSCNILFDSSYPTGGEEFTARSVGLTEVTDMYVRAGVGASAAGSQAGLSILLGGTKTTPKVLAYDAAGTEVTDTTDLSLRGLNVIILGK